jgi:hypothetical protein
MPDLCFALTLMLCAHIVLSGTTILLQGNINQKKALHQSRSLAYLDATGEATDGSSSSS